MHQGGWKVRIAVCRAGMPVYRTVACGRHSLYAPVQRVPFTINPHPPTPTQYSTQFHTQPHNLHSTSHPPRASSSANCRSTRGLPPSTAGGNEGQGARGVGEEGQLNKRGLAAPGRAYCRFTRACASQHCKAPQTGQSKGTLLKAFGRRHAALCQTVACPPCARPCRPRCAPHAPAFGSNVSCSQRDCLRCRCCRPVMVARTWSATAQKAGKRAWGGEAGQAGRFHVGS